MKGELKPSSGFLFADNMSRTFDICCVMVRFSKNLNLEFFYVSHEKSHHPTRNYFKQ